MAHYVNPHFRRSRDDIRNCDRLMFAFAHGVKPWVLPLGVLVSFLNLSSDPAYQDLPPKLQFAENSRAMEVRGAHHSSEFR
jgi:hypothetical protein